jgi:Tol biopolymer transport system component
VASGGAAALPFAASAQRDEVLLALGDDGTMLINRWRARSGSGRVVQRFGLDGRPRGRAVSWDGIERREWSPFEAVSPDGAKIAFRQGRGSADTTPGPVRIELASSAHATHRVVSPYFDVDPSVGWSPDGRTLVIAGRRHGRWAAWTLDPGARRARRRMALSRPASVRDLTVAPGGARFAYTTYDKHVHTDVAVVDLGAGTQGLLQPAEIRQAPLNGPLRLRDPLWSPAGDRIAAERDGTFGVELLDPAGAARTVIAIEHGFAAIRAWSPDGRSLAYEFEGERVHELRVYDVASGATRVLASWRVGRVFTLMWSPDSNLLGLTMVPS